jgi:hypothetical protein
MTGTKAQTEESTDPISLLYFRIVLLFWTLCLMADNLLTEYALKNGFYESNPFTNWMIQYVGIDISLSIHTAILLAGIIGLDIIYQKSLKFKTAIFVITSFFMAVWFVNDIQSFLMLL